MKSKLPAGMAKSIAAYKRNLAAQKKLLLKALKENQKQQQLLKRK